ncbi:MAG: hypothetical protein R3C53_08650 [Pirellulaceae bacterium]
MYDRITVQPCLLMSELAVKSNICFRNWRAKVSGRCPQSDFLTEQTIAGAISTGTHGSGRHSLSHYVIGVRVARYDPQTGDAVIVDITDGDELRAARCSLVSFAT